MGCNPENLTKICTGQDLKKKEEEKELKGYYELYTAVIITAGYMPFLFIKNKISEKGILNLPSYINLIMNGVKWCGLIFTLSVLGSLWILANRESQIYAHYKNNSDKVLKWWKRGAAVIIYSGMILSLLFILFLFYCGWKDSILELLSKIKTLFY